MNYTRLKKKIIEYARSIGIPKIGFTDAKPLTDHLVFLTARQKAGYKYGINEGDPERRIDPSKHLIGAQSIISITIPYPPEVYVEAYSMPPDQQARGYISLISRSVDYHELVMNKLRKLQNFIKDLLPEAKTVPMVDKEEILEKALAAKAGLGWIGKNTLLLTPEFGSQVSLGELITDIPFPIDKPIPSACGNCNCCRDACPTSALGKESGLNPDLCLAGVSQYKGNIEHHLREALGVSIYGCDICQLVCPYNRKSLDRLMEGGEKNTEIQDYVDNAYPLLTELLELTNKGFRGRFGHTAGAWRGRTVFQRNAIIAAGNLKDPFFLPALIRLLQEDGRPVIRSTAAWALGKIGGQDSLHCLQKALKTEKHPEVKAEIVQALKEI